MEHICNRDRKHHRWALNWQKYSMIWPSFFLPSKNAYNSFSVLKQFHFFLSLFKVLHYKRISQKQGLKKYFLSVFLSLWSLPFLSVVFCDRTIKNWKALVDILYVIFFHDIVLPKIPQKEPDTMKEKIPNLCWIFKYSFHIVFVCLLKLLFIFD